MSFRNLWRKKTIIVKSMFIGGVVSLIFSIFIGFLFMVIPSLMSGKLVCGTLGGDVGCGNFLGFLLLFLVYIFWSLVFTFIPMIILGAITGFIVKKLKKPNENKK